MRKEGLVNYIIGVTIMSNMKLDMNIMTVAKIKDALNAKGIAFEYTNSCMCKFKLFPGITIYVCRNNKDLSVYMYGIHEYTFANVDGVGNSEINDTINEVVRLKNLYDIVN